jgi:hemoglobin/transferrin/lactoferrin receptor protein
MYKKSILSASILIALSQGAYAEGTSTFNEVVVSATRTNSQIEDTAASVAVVTDENIEESMITGLDELFEYTPGVTVKTNPRQGVQSINIRGIEGNRIKVLVDGVSQGNQFESGSNFINSSRVEVDTDLVKAVEVVKGAASSLHGSDAIGGIVAFETKDPSDFLKGRDFGGHAKFNYSSEDNTFSESVALANKTGELESLVAYTRRDGNELDNFGDLLDADTAANNLLVKLQYQLNADHRLEFSGNYIRNENDGNQSYSGYTDGRSEDTTEQYQVGIKHIWDAQASVADTLTWQLDYLSKDERGLTHRVKGINNQLKDYTYSDEGFQFDMQLDKYLTLGDTEHYIIYGASYLDKDIKNINNEYNSSSPDREMFYMPSASEHRYGFFLQDEITAGNFTVTPGIRYDSFETDPGDASANQSGNTQDEYQKHCDSAFTARLGTLYRLNETHSLFAQVSQGFRAPDFKELFYSYGHKDEGYINKPNPDLKAEESISYEFGWRHNNEFSSSEVSLFYSDYENFIEYRTISGDGTDESPAINQYVNVGKATIKGIEFSNQLSWDKFMPVKGFSSRVAAAYTEGENGDNDPLNSVNPWNIVAGLNYDSEQDWGSSLTVNYIASKDSSDIDGENILPISSATVIDVTAYYKPIQDLTLRAGVFNVADEEYYNWNDVRGVETENKDLTQAGRNWAITAKYEF